MKQIIFGMTTAIICLSSVGLLPTIAEPLLWQTYWQKAGVALKSKDYSLACELLTAALKEIDVPGPPTDSLIMTVSSLGYAQRQLKKYDEAKSNLNRAWELAGQLHEEDRYAWVLIELGSIAERQDDLVGAEKQYRAAITAMEKLPPASVGDPLATCFEHLAGLSKSQGKTVEADALLEKAAELRKGSTSSINQLYTEGIAAMTSGDYDLAVEKLNKVVELSPGFSRAKINLGLAYQNQAVQLEKAGKLNEAEERYKKSLGTVQSASGPENPLIADVLSGLVETLESGKKYPEALNYSKRMTALRQKYLNSTNQDRLEQALQTEARLLKHLGRTVELKEIERQATAALIVPAIPSDEKCKQYCSALTRALTEKWSQLPLDKQSMDGNTFGRVTINKNGTLGNVFVEHIGVANPERDQLVEKIIRQVFPFQALPISGSNSLQFIMNLQRGSWTVSLTSH